MTLIMMTMTTTMMTIMSVIITTATMTAADVTKQIAVDDDIKDVGFDEIQMR